MLYSSPYREIPNHLTATCYHSTALTGPLNRNSDAHSNASVRKVPGHNQIIKISVHIFTNDNPYHITYAHCIFSNYLHLWVNVYS